MKIKFKPLRWMDQIPLEDYCNEMLQTGYRIMFACGFMMIFKRVDPEYYRDKQCYVVLDTNRGLFNHNTSKNENSSVRNFFESFDLDYVTSFGFLSVYIGDRGYELYTDDTTQQREFKRFFRGNIKCDLVLGIMYLCQLYMLAPKAFESSSYGLGYVSAFGKNGYFMLFIIILFWFLHTGHKWIVGTYYLKNTETIVQTPIRERSSIKLLSMALVLLIVSLLFLQPSIKPVIVVTMMLLATYVWRLSNVIIKSDTRFNRVGYTLRYVLVFYLISSAVFSYVRPTISVDETVDYTKSHLTESIYFNPACSSNNFYESVFITTGYCHYQGDNIEYLEVKSSPLDGLIQKVIEKDYNLSRGFNQTQGCSTMARGDAKLCKEDNVIVITTP